MKKKSDKDLLFERMEKVDPTFKRRINEEENYSTDSNEYYGITNVLGEEGDGIPLYFTAKTKEEVINTLNRLIGSEQYYIDDLDDKYARFESYISDDWAFVTSDENVFKKNIGLIKDQIGIEPQPYKAELNESDDEFVPHGRITVSNAGGYEIMLDDSGEAAKVRDAFGSDNPETSDWLEIEYVPDEESGESEPVIDPNGYNIPLNKVMRTNKRGLKEQWHHNDYKQTQSFNPEEHPSYFSGREDDDFIPSNREGYTNDIPNNKIEDFFNLQLKDSQRFGGADDVPFDVMKDEVLAAMKNLGVSTIDALHDEFNKINEEVAPINPDDYLPSELKGSEDATKILTKINELLDLLNDSNIDQSEGGVSDKMREMALHMIESNR